MVVGMDVDMPGGIKPVPSKRAADALRNGRLPLHAAVSVPCGDEPSETAADVAGNMAANRRLALPRLSFSGHFLPESQPNKKQSSSCIGSSRCTACRPAADALFSAVL